MTHETPELAKAIVARIYAEWEEYKKNPSEYLSDHYPDIVPIREALSLNPAPFPELLEVSVLRGICEYYSKIEDADIRMILTISGPPLVVFHSFNSKPTRGELT